MSKQNGFVQNFLKPTVFSMENAKSNRKTLFLETFPLTRVFCKLFASVNSHVQLDVSFKKARMCNNAQFISSSLTLR